MKTTPAYRSATGKYYASIRPFKHGRHYVRAIRASHLTEGHWSESTTIRTWQVERHWTYEPADMRLPVGELYSDEA